ncbi:MAG: large conductance mechanosensitive channel protein MscL [Burkholderiaceae bacterium]
MGMMSEFKDFIAKGNVMDLAVGVIIGAAFGKIVDSLVKDVIMPVVASIFGGLDFSSKYIMLGKIPDGVANTYKALSEAGAPVLAWGNFLTVVINFLILAFIIFQMVKMVNRLKGPAPEAAPAAPPADVQLLTEIRDLLKR